jgi:hypothetical protein
MILTPLQPVLVTTTIGNTFDLRTVHISPDDAANAVSMVLTTTQCLQQSQSYWSARDVMALTTVGCATVHFATPTQDTLSTVLLHKLANLNSVNAADASKCFTATKDAIITAKQCNGRVPSLCQIDIGNVNQLKRILTKAQHDTSGQTLEVTAVEFDICRAVQNPLINARVRGQLMMSAHVHASTARGVVKDTLAVQAELKIPSLLAQQGIVELSASIGKSITSVITVYNPYKVPVWVALVELADTTNGKTHVFDTVTVIDYNNTSGLVLMPNATAVIGSVTFTPPVTSSINKLYHDHLFLRSNATVLEHIAIVGRVVL